MTTNFEKLFETEVLTDKDLRKWFHTLRQNIYADRDVQTVESRLHTIGWSSSKRQHLKKLTTYFASEKHVLRKMLSTFALMRGSPSKLQTGT